MSPQTRHLIEKVQVQIASAAAALAGWFLLWPIVRPWDPHEAMAFLPSGDIGRLGALAVGIWAIAAVCAMLTLSARPEGALLATLAGAAAVSLHSEGVPILLKYADAGPGKVFALLGAEMLAMAGILVGAMLIIALLRAISRRFAGRWAWVEPPAPPPAEAPAKAGKDKQAPKIVQLPPAAHWASALAVELAVALVLLVLTFRSPQRGQIAFALIGSFLVGALVAHQTFPLKSAAPFWIAPLLMGVLITLLGAFSQAQAGPRWYHAMFVASELPLRAALPAHWLGLACGGAVAGLWISRRLREHEATQRAQN